MRIVGGQWKGHRIQAPAGETTRPTIDRVREAVFSAVCARLPDGFDGLDVLDAFAGSGALGLEALSRGARHVCFVERDRRALGALKANIEHLGVQSRANVVHGDVFAVISKRLNGVYSVILLDPPYQLASVRVASLLEGLVLAGRVADEALVVWEHHTKMPAVWPEGFYRGPSKRYGAVEVDFALFAGEGEG
ncbi:MAG: 16S rRNA (guanine(966)-N(2))-methyltransferase RsmD [Coriobacteriia bacterium]|nr:16S rRNA (guanine(966)-N(2))-methyltransferase RsmD [Coriobacteriia bacterium]